MPSGGDADWKRLIEKDIDEIRQRQTQIRDWVMMILGGGILIGGAIGLFAKQIVAFILR